MWNPNHIIHWYSPKAHCTDEYVNDHQTNILLTSWHQTMHMLQHTVNGWIPKCYSICVDQFWSLTYSPILLSCRLLVFCVRIGMKNFKSCHILPSVLQTVPRINFGAKGLWHTTLILYTLALCTTHMPHRSYYATMALTTSVQYPYLHWTKLVILAKYWLWLPDDGFFVNGNMLEQPP
jgi:hypothetical protein